MKKFIVFIITAIIATSFTAKAQYIDKNTSQSIFSQQANFYDLPQYQEANANIKNGKMLFFAGLGCATIGGVIVALSPMLIKHDIHYGRYDEEFDRYGEVLETWRDGGHIVTLISGSAIATTGIVLNIIGICKWAHGSGEIKKMKYAYMFSGNGLTISF